MPKYVINKINNEKRESQIRCMVQFDSISFVFVVISVKTCAIIVVVVVFLESHRSDSLVWWELQSIGNGRHVIRVPLHSNSQKFCLLLVFLLWKPSHEVNNLYPVLFQFILSNECLLLVWVYLKYLEVLGLSFLVEDA